MYFSRGLSRLRPSNAARALHMLVRCALLKPAQDIGTFLYYPLYWYTLLLSVLSLGHSECALQDRLTAMGGRSTCMLHA